MSTSTRKLTVEISESRSGNAFKDTGEDADRLSTKLDGAASSAGGLSDKLSRGRSSSNDYASGLDRVGEAGGTAETRFLGLGAGISGVSTLMSGDAGPEDYAMAMADLGDSIEHTVIPAWQTLKTSVLSTITNTAKLAATHVASAAKVVASWVVMGVQSMLNAAKMAIAWMIAMGPAILIIAAVVAAIALLIIHWDTVREVALAVWDAIWGGIKAVWNWITENWPLLLAILTGPIGIAVLMIVRHWDTIRDAFGAVMDWIGARVSGARDFIVGVFTGVVEWFRGLPGSIASAAAGMWDGITSAFKSAINALIGLWNNFEISFGGYDIPGPGPNIPSFTLRTPNIPYLAQGGIVPATPGGRLAVIGEGQHDEAVIPLRPGMGMGGPTEVVIDMRGAIVADERQFEQMVNKAFRNLAAKGVPITVKGRTL